MRIILEGPDGAGKSTLAGQLGDHFKYVHHGLYPEDDGTKKDQLKRVWLSYEYLLINFPHLVPYNYTWEAQGQPGILKIEATKKNLWTGPSWLPDGCLGSPEARFLIVGERVNPRKYW